MCVLDLKTFVSCLVLLEMFAVEIIAILSTVLRAVCLCELL